LNATSSRIRSFYFLWVGLCRDESPAYRAVRPVAEASFVGGLVSGASTHVVGTPVPAPSVRPLWGLQIFVKSCKKQVHSTRYARSG
jgi:hypothetical protein